MHWSEVLQDETVGGEIRKTEETKESGEIRERHKRVRKGALDTTTTTTGGLQR